jgi:hypothetical protein
MAKKYTIKELAEHLNLSETEIMYFVKSGDLNFSRIAGLKIVFREKHVKGFMPVLEKYIIQKGTVGVTIGEMGIALKTMSNWEMSPRGIMAQLKVKVGQRVGKGAGPLMENEGGMLELEPTIRKEGLQLIEIKDPCQWNPEINDLNKGFMSGWEHHVKATWIIGANGKWRLCDGCAALPKFKRFTVRKRIE